MSEPFVGEIRMFAGNFAPRGWAFCDGQLLAVSQNDALFALLGTIYGGDGRTTFGLPDLRGRLPIHQGNGPGLSPRTIGSAGGAEQVTVTVPELPAHSHELGAVDQNATEVDGDADDTLGRTVGYDLYVPPDNPVGMSSAAVSAVGGSQPHSNVMPFLCINFIIALVGIFPSRN